MAGPQVPGSHRDPRNPRGPNDGIVVSAPIPGTRARTPTQATLDR